MILLEIVLDLPADKDPFLGSRRLQKHFCITWSWQNNPIPKIELQTGVFHLLHE